MLIATVFGTNFGIARQQCAFQQKPVGPGVGDNSLDPSFGSDPIQPNGIVPGSLAISGVAVALMLRSAFLHTGAIGGFSAPTELCDV